MGDWFQTIADVEASLSEAEEIATRILDWLIELQVIERTPKHCVLGSGQGYPPRKYELVVDPPPPDPDLRRLMWNGLEVSVGRQIFHNGQSGVTITCPNCNAHAPDKWSDAVTEWYKNEGTALLECIECGNVQPVTDWVFTPAWGFGNLGFTFWNWPPLKKSFLDEFVERIGHRTVFIEDKL
jgi:Zn ribbon nucleic-acid-binding protein